jgi:hypothetical protein
MLECIARLTAAGIDSDDAHALRRISMTLHRWHEMECGDDNGHASWTITRGHKKNGDFTHDDNGKPYIETHPHSGGKTTYYPTADREAGAKRRLNAIMKRYPTLQAYIQGDPRGAALYIIRPGDVREGADVDSCYSNGIAVYK